MVDEKLGKEEAIEELSEEQFNKLAEGSLGGKVDYEAVWKSIENKILTTKQFNAAVNVARKTAGLSERDLYFSERERVFQGWEKQGRKIITRVGRVANKKTNVYKFVAAP